MTFVRRFAGVALASAPLALLSSSIASGDTSTPSPRLAVGLAGAALAVALFNIWLAFGRPLYLRWRHPLTKFPRVSGIPGVGTVLAVAASVAGFGMLGPSLLALLAVILEVGGLPWFVVWTWRDKSLWDPR
jgi:hypothetical protein